MSRFQWLPIGSPFEERPFRRVFERVRRPLPPDPEIVTAYTDGQVTLRSNRSKEGYHEAADLSGFQGVEVGDFVVHGLDILRGSVGVADSAGALSSVCIVCVPRVESDPRFFAYAMRAQAWAGVPRALAKGVREGGADFRRWETLADLPLPVPSLSEQRAIADHLDAATARIDALISKKRRLVELHEEGWRSAVKHRMKILTDEHGVTPLKRLVSCLDGTRVPLSAEERSHRSGPYPYYGASGMIDSVDDYLFDETLVLLGEDGAQLADRDYEVSFVVEGRVWVNNHAHVLRAVNSDPQFLAMHLSTFDRDAFISGSTREKITQADMNEIPVPNVSASHQLDVARGLILERTKCDRTTSALSRQIELLSERRQALITAVVTGEMPVPAPT